MKLVPLGTVAEVIAGQSPEGFYYNSNGDGTPFYQGKKEFGEKFLGPPTTWTTKITKLAQSGDILMSVRAPVGPINFSTQEICIGRGLASIRASELVDKNFLFYFLLHKQPEISGNTGAVFDSINKDQIAGIKIPLPSLDRQREIVEKLDGVFAEMDLLEDNFALSEIKSNELLKSILTSEYSSPHLKIEPLEKLVDILDNQRIPINATERLQRVGDVPYYGATGQVGTIDKAIFNETLLLLGEDGVPFFDQTKHKAYEISGPSWVNNHAHVLRAKPGVVVQRYLLHFLNIFNYTGYVNGATRLKLTQGDMKRMPVPLPSLEVQAKIVSKIDLVFEQIGELRKQIGIKKVSATELRQSILSNAFIQKETVA
jgi:type I restriction enzyme S subunit